MATLTTKYSIGDTVYRAGTVTTRKRHPCPDCLGAQKWQVKSPAGTDYEFPCPRCSARYMSDHDLSLDYSAYTPSVSRLTIGSIQYNTAQGSYDEGARYMCHETGIGSGSVYNETNLYETEEAAQKASQAQADSQNASVEWVVTQFNKSLEISDYQLDSAALKLAKDETHRARMMTYGLGDLFGSLEEADDKAAILEAIEDYKKYDWAREKERADLSAPSAGGRS